MAKKAAAKKTPAAAKKKPAAKKAAALKTRPTGGSVDAYLAGIADPARRADVEALHALITKVAPDLTPKLWGKIIGYGSYSYHYPSGRSGEWFVLGLASNAASISVYVSATSPGGRYVAEQHAASLAPASVGKSCIRFRRLAQLDPAALERVLREGAARAR